MTENFLARAMVVSTETTYCRHDRVLADGWVHQTVADPGESVFLPASPVYAFAIAAGEGRPQTEIRTHGEDSQRHIVRIVSVSRICGKCACSIGLSEQADPFHCRLRSRWRQ